MLCSVAFLLDLLEEVGAETFAAVVLFHFHMEIGKWKIVMSQKSTCRHNHSLHFEDIVADRFGLMPKNGCVEGPLSKNTLGVNKLCPTQVLKQDCVRLDVPTEFAEYGEEPKIIALAFDPLRMRHREQGLESKICLCPEIRLDEKLERRVAVGNFLTVDCAVAYGCAGTVKNVVISPAALVTGIIADLKVALLKKVLAERLNALEICF